MFLVLPIFTSKFQAFALDGPKGQGPHGTEVALHFVGGNKHLAASCAGRNAMRLN